MKDWNVLVCEVRYNSKVLFEYHQNFVIQGASSGMEFQSFLQPWWKLMIFKVVIPGISRGKEFQNFQRYQNFQRWISSKLVIQGASSGMDFQKFLQQLWG